jgi:hypothetical protein
MRKREPKEAEPPCTLHAVTGNLAGGMEDPVLLDDRLCVEQEELTRLTHQGGTLPIWLVVDDYSGSYRYICRVYWTDEEYAAAKLTPPPPQGYESIPDAWDREIAARGHLNRERGMGALPTKK